MGKLDPARKERDLMRKWFLEGAHLRGTNVTLELPEDVDRDIYYDPSIDEFDTFEIDLVLDERPDKRTLENLNWYHEDEDYVPLLAYIGTKLPEEYHNDENKYLHILRNSLIKIEDHFLETFETNIFEVSDIKRTPYYVWVCNLTPFREEYEEDEIPEGCEVEDFDDENYNILQVKDEG